ncbi:DUF418 domain-containing protein (plasmid) [Pseudoalteromonas sp. T1lg65]|uniref:DUF418 domain-containing protein n=1 Tax=Pseudoalteromonas sp. T1lg65 TaxID=2077101 RepID=UPI003F78F7DA
MNRIITIDVIRGLALLGLLSMNVFHFANFELGYVANDPAHPLDSLLQSINIIFFDSKFRTLFAMLFGVALCMQLQSRTNEVIKRRLKVIAVIGLLHGYLIWPGDILLNYAFSGFIAFSIIKGPQTSLRTKSLLLFLIPTILMFAIGLLDPEPNHTRSHADYIQALSNLPNDYLSLLLSNLIYFSLMVVVMFIVTLWYTAGLMLFGAMLFRRGFFDLENRQDESKIIAAGVIAFIVSIIMAQSDLLPKTALEALTWALAVPVALLYAVIVKQVLRSGLSALSWLASTGRLALTLYISQSVFMTIYFVFLFPEYRESYNRIDYFSLFVVFAVLQLVIAHLYFKLFKQGPLEWCVSKVVNK